ncbi:hypothetical protein E4U33_000795 [Claviceps sp. LM78 group G4]|nr:hypothetical protein E4U33_000795 [Claviceps sp. LM78 group G4]
MQALKLFTQSNHSVNSTSGQGAFLGMAMTEASKVGLNFLQLISQQIRSRDKYDIADMRFFTPKLFDDKAAQGKVQGGASKENVVQHAVETAMKMYFKSQATSQGGLAGMAAKFLG